jgi:hypothetical protein
LSETILEKQYGFCDYPHGALELNLRTVIAIDPQNINPSTLCMAILSADSIKVAVQNHLCVSVMSLPSPRLFLEQPFNDPIISYVIVMSLAVRLPWERRLFPTSRAQEGPEVKGE